MIGLQPSATWEELVFKPAQESVPGPDGTSLFLKDLRVPVRVRKSWWYRAKTQLIWLVLFGLLVFGKDVAEPYWHDKPLTVPILTATTGFISRPGI